MLKLKLAINQVRRINFHVFDTPLVPIIHQLFFYIFYLLIISRTINY